MLYCLSGNVIVILWASVVLFHVFNWNGAQRSHVIEVLGPLNWVLLALGLLFLFVFPFALICTIALIASMTGRYATAERLYHLSLNLRTSIPVVGKTARVDFWKISLANCYRDLGRYDEAERLYTEVIERQKALSSIERVTHYGLSESARENYAALVQRTGRNSDVDAVSDGIAKVLVALRVKYCLAVTFVLTGGLLFALWLHYALGALAGI